MHDAKNMKKHPEFVCGCNSLQQIMMCDVQKHKDTNVHTFQNLLLTNSNL